MVVVPVLVLQSHPGGVCAVFGCGIVLGVFGGVSIVHFVVFISILLC